jgi:hypothetical protein
MTLWNNVLPQAPFALRHCYSTLVDLETPMEPAWRGMHVRHTWNSVPDYWESLDYPRSIVQTHYENVLTDALYEVSYPRHPECMLSNTPSLMPVFTFAVLYSVVRGAGS